MKDYVKGGLKVFGSYAIADLFFLVFLYTFIAISKDNFSNWLPYYSFVIFLFLFLLLYSDIKRLALKEIKPQYDLNPYPLKGLVYGLVGFLPIILLELVYPLIVFNDPALNRIKELLLNSVMGPVFFILRLGNKSVLSYILASLAIPFITMLGYLAGFHNFELKKRIGKADPKIKVEQTFKKSPWNPSIGERPKKKRKKKTL